MYVLFSVQLDSILMVKLACEIWKVLQDYRFNSITELLVKGEVKK